MQIVWTWRSRGSLFEETEAQKRWDGTGQFGLECRSDERDDSRRKWWRWRRALCTNVWLRKSEAGDGRKQVGRLIGCGTGKVQEQNKAVGRERRAAQMSYDEVQPPEAISLASLRRRGEMKRSCLGSTANLASGRREKHREGKKDTNRRSEDWFVREDCFDRRD